MADETGAWRARLGSLHQPRQRLNGAGEAASSYRIPFGKHKGEPLHALPDDYLQWLATRDLREPLCSAVRRELQTRGHKQEVLTMDARLQEARLQGFFLVQEGHESEVRAYQQWCVETGVPSVCVAMGNEAATVAISYVRVTTSPSLLLGVLQKLNERWPSYAPQLLPPASIVFVGIPRAVIIEVMPELVSLVRTSVSRALTQEEHASPSFTM